MELAKDMRNRPTAVVKYIRKYTPEYYVPPKGTRHECRRVQGLLE